MMKLKAQPHSFQVGDHVKVKAKLVNNSTPLYDPIAYTISVIKESVITAERKDHTITQNCTFFRKLDGKESLTHS